MDKAIQFLSAVISHISPELSKEAKMFFIEGLTSKKLKKKEHFIEVKKVHNQIGFVANGLVRGYYVNEQGDEITTRFVKEGNFATHYRAFLNQQPSKYYFQCIEDTTLLCFDYKHIKEGYQKFPDFDRFGRLIAEGIINVLEYRMESFQFENAEERYLQFMQTSPDLFNRVSITHLASYLGVTRPSLSRIRNNIAKK